MEHKVELAPGCIFTLPPRYDGLKVVGRGSYGMVAKATDRSRGARVAIKRVMPMAEHSIDAKHVLREIRMMRHLGEHENIVKLEDLVCREKDDELYIVMELLDSDLHRIIQSSQVLTEQHIRLFMLQLLRGVQFLHENGIIHRDLKPGNLLVTRNCDLRISDFGLARAHSAGTSSDGLSAAAGMTEHVVTRWYRPPELMLSPNGFYDYSVDIWSCACIMGELLLRTPVFPGKNFVHQLTLIFNVLGPPSADEVAYIQGKQARRYLQNLQVTEGVSFAELLPGASSHAVSLMEEMLVFSPAKRLSPEDSLQHPFLLPFIDEPCHIPSKPQGLCFDFEKPGVTRSYLKHLILEEADHFARLRRAREDKCRADEVRLEREHERERLLQYQPQPHLQPLRDEPAQVLELDRGAVRAPICGAPLPCSSAPVQGPACASSGSK
jgi:serine/threonine protein kinase